METVIEIYEKINDESVSKEDLNILLQNSYINANEEAKKEIQLLRNRSVSIHGSNTQVAVLEEFLKQKKIATEDMSILNLHVKSLDDTLACDEADIIVVDELEKIILNSSRLEAIEYYILQQLREVTCSNAIAVSIVFMDQYLNDRDEYEDQLDTLGSQNPDRDIRIYSNERELYNTIELKLKQKELLHYTKLKELLDVIINENSSIEEIEEVRNKYRQNNDYKKRYQEVKALLINVAQTIAPEVSSTDFKERLHVITQQLQNQSFSIGVTGIIKAGKSTMMNALLGEDILGTAIRPETANLTVIKKDDKPHAKVYYWSDEEWNNIRANALDEQSKQFVQESEALPNFSNYIEPSSKNVEIKIEELDNYTSARKSNKLCNLVKEVEVSLPLEFLDGGVTLVDTPGIDDPVVQREIITQEYLRSCSAILHLMNAKQSTTQKDIEFIGDALIEQGISSLLVVITRVDTLGDSKEEIDRELVSIIKQSKAQIEKYLSRRSSEDISSILAKVEFLPLAGKFALQHRTGQAEKAVKKGYVLEDTGILEVENYISSMLFGEKNTRAKLAIENAHRVIETGAQNYLKTLHDRYALIGLDAKQIAEKLHTLKSEQEDIKSQLHTISEEVKSETTKLFKTFKHLKDTFEQDFDTFRKGLVDEISSYIISELYDGKKPDENRIKNEIEIKIKTFIEKKSSWYQKQAEIRLDDSIEYIDGQYAQLSLPQQMHVNLDIDKLDDIGDMGYSLIMVGLGGALGFAGAFLLGPVGWIGAVFLTWWAGDWIDDQRHEKLQKQVNKKMAEVDKKLAEVFNRLLAKLNFQHSFLYQN